MTSYKQWRLLIGWRTRSILVLAACIGCCSRNMRVVVLKNYVSSSPCISFSWHVAWELVSRDTSRSQPRAWPPWSRKLHMSSRKASGPGELPEGREEGRRGPGHLKAHVPLPTLLTAFTVTLPQNGKNKQKTETTPKPNLVHRGKWKVKTSMLERPKSHKGWE